MLSQLWKYEPVIWRETTKSAQCSQVTKEVSLINCRRGHGTTKDEALTCIFFSLQYNGILLKLHHDHLINPNRVTSM